MLKYHYIIKEKSSQNGNFNLKLQIEEKEKVDPFLLMTNVFNQVETTNLFTTIQQYSELPSNTFSIKLWYEDNKF